MQAQAKVSSLQYIETLYVRAIEIKCDINNAFNGPILIMKIAQALHAISENQDIGLLLEIQHFSSLMAHQNSKLTAYGFMDLDASLLTKVIASAAMYVVILMQLEE
ncbi:uncharacterized protein LOC142977745 [Anticarsia gemmatalis]|uniref:uncharacterized protein LOC142977745 n=1 Tax=Anticarsia gemmatalis TaxID=129554 RepID=UPI003F759FF6